MTSVESDSPSRENFPAGAALEPARADPRTSLVRVAPSAGVVAIFAIVVALAWIATVGTADSLSNLLMLQLSGADPVARLSFLSLVGVMMGAMMLPSAIPMLITYRGLALIDSTRQEAAVRTTLFSAAYLLLWLAFTGAALLLLLLFGLLAMLSGPAVLIPGLLLIAAGVYQFTSWKSYCLAKCRTPIGFVLQYWRTGRSGAVRMGFAHGIYCLGCCWVLMLVVFVTGGMSLLWMAGFSALVLVEKVWSRGELLARLLGAIAVVAGAAVVLWLGLSPAAF